MKSAKELAKDFLKHEVLRGDTLQQICAGCGGSCSNGVWISIGGYINSKPIKRDEIAVEFKEKKEVAVFRIKDLIAEIKAGTRQISLF